MAISLDGGLLHERISQSCLTLFDDGHFPQAAAEAMKQVELALKEASGARPRLCGWKLLDYAFGGKRPIRVQMRLGPESEEAATRLFYGAFGYYRNYAVHDGANIDAVVAARILVVASELMDLIGASSRSFTGEGGIDRLVREGIFADAEQFTRLLRWLDGHSMPAGVYDGLFESLYECGFGDDQMQAAFELGLVEMTWHAPEDDDLPWDENGIEGISLTPEGEHALQDASKRAKRPPK